MRNLKMIIQYDGSRYKGWQKQKNQANTIQAKLEHVLSELAKEELQVIGCGRTDAGVHAKQYVANVHTKMTYSTQEILDYCNQYLPQDIVVQQIKDTSERFHSRYNIKRKTYAYVINLGNVPNVFKRKYSWFIKEPLDLEKMREASQYLLGTHDFKSFTNLKSKTKSTLRTIESIDIEPIEDGIILRFKGNGFLWNMVRILTGTLVDVGLGKRAPEEVKAILEAKERQTAGPMAPAEGLFLESLEY